MKKRFHRLWDSRPSRKPARPRPVSLRLEKLEDRLAPAVITVNFTGDTIAVDGLASLREAITSINNQADVNGDVTLNRVGGYAASPGGTPDVINFNIAAAGLQTISATSAEPTIVMPLTINGYSQVGASANSLANADNAVILIQLNGAGAGANVDALTLGAGSGGSTIRGLDITNFTGNGIVVASNGNSILGNFIGVNPTGTTRMPNGTFPNSGDGIRIVNGSNNQIGSTTPGARNIVSGNALDGIHVVGTLTTPATGNIIQGNFVGVAADGKSSVGNRTEPAPATGAPEGNNLFGIEISGGNVNTVGGTTAGARNVVGFNAAGIEVDNGGQQNVIQGNFVGVGADGVTPTGNLLQGVVLRSSNGLSAPLGPGQPNEPGVSCNLFGGTAAGAGNLVEFNGTAGVAVFGNPVSASGQPNIGNAIEGNSVFKNGRSNPTFLLGIDLTNQFVFPKDDGVTPNDSKGHGAPNDPNNFQNFPVLASAASSGGQTTITGVLKSAPVATYRVEFFASNSDPLGGIAEGQQFLGFTSVTTDGNGNASFSVVLNVPVADGRIITATATDAIGNTSEFSAGLTVSTPPPPPTVQQTPPPSISVAFSPSGQEIAEVVNAQGVMTQIDSTGAHVLGVGVRSASVAFDSAGNMVVEVVTLQGQLTQFDSMGAHALGNGGVSSASVAFGPFGEVLEVVGTNGVLTQFDSTGVHVLGGSVLSAGVAFTPSGQQVLEVVGTNGVLTQFDAAGAHQLSSGGVLDASVAFTPSGAAEVIDLIFQDGTAAQFDSAGEHILGKFF
jgi:hypothetical protein